MAPDATKSGMHDNIQEWVRLAGGLAPCVTNISSTLDCWFRKEQYNTAALDSGANDLHVSDRLAAWMLTHHSDGVIYEVWLILHVQGCELRYIDQTSHKLPVAELPHICSIQDEGVLSGYGPAEAC